MAAKGQTSKGLQRLLLSLTIFGYLTAPQATRLLYQPGSLTYVQAMLKTLVDRKLAVALGGRNVHLPRIYTLTATGRRLAASLGASTDTRFRAAEEREKSASLFFLRHTLAVIDFLIAAKLLSQTQPAITLTRLYREQELKRKIYVQIPEKICLEPDASVHFTITETWHEPPQVWEDFFHIEVYRTLPPRERRYKQKIHGYVTYAATGQHEVLFATPAISILILAQTPDMAATLKQWTEEALQEMGRAADGDWFFFTSVDPGSVSPEKLFLSPVWENAFGTAFTPLLLLAEAQRITTKEM
jgi:protein involved in plasmid replication-relaxation